MSNDRDWIVRMYRDGLYKAHSSRILSYTVIYFRNKYNIGFSEMDEIMNKIIDKAVEDEKNNSEGQHDDK